MEHFDLETYVGENRVTVEGRFDRDGEIHDYTVFLGSEKFDLEGLYVRVRGDFTGRLVSDEVEETILAHRQRVLHEG